MDVVFISGVLNALDVRCEISDTGELQMEFNGKHGKDKMLIDMKCKIQEWDFIYVLKYTDYRHVYQSNELVFTFDISHKVRMKRLCYICTHIHLSPYKCFTLIIITSSYPDDALHFSVIFAFNRRKC